MEYLCLTYDDESKRRTIPKEQMDTMMSEYYAFTESIKKSGQYLFSQKLGVAIETGTATEILCHLRILLAEYARS
jgi:hypothetical protein